MKEIQLTNGKVTIVDDSDYEWLMQWRWYFNLGGYAVRNAREGECVYMHRLIMDAPPELYTDHRNRIRLDNRRCNLRNCTPTQSMWNHPPKPNKHGFPGVMFLKNRKRGYLARIRVFKKTICLGYFATAKEASDAYNVAKVKYFGEFACFG